ncbi:hypothetical protein H0H87_008034 [Tephrocybe sp. NHM501043]|nr:hypothetical protein H0H87_008034 [Tephrocybe sp. NHM501043]
MEIDDAPVPLPHVKLINYNPLSDTVPILSSALDVSCHSPEDVKSCGYAQIKNDIGLLEATIVKLKARHNSLSLVARLPPEILMKVFKSLQLMYQANNQGPWLRVSFVSSQWRQTALGCPELWSTIQTDFTLERLSTYISRSRLSPLSIYHPGDHYWNPKSECMEAVLCQMHRVRVLADTGYIKGRSSISKHSSLLQTAAPILESVKIKGAISEAAPVLRGPLFSGDAPRLCVLDLRDCRLPPTFASETLKSLTLVQSKVSQAPVIGDLLALLKGTPKLEILVLGEAFHAYEKNTDRDSETLYLPCLSLLELRFYSFPQILSVYEHIRHPCSIRVRLLTTTSQYDRSDFRIHVQKIESLPRLATVIEDRMVVIRGISIQAFHFFHLIDFSSWDYHEEIPGQTQSNMGEPKTSLELARSSDNYTLFLKLFASLHLTDLVYLSIEWRNRDPGLTHTRYNSFCRAFGHLASLSTICIVNANQDLDWIFQLGDNTFGLGGSSLKDKLSFRSLRTLILEGWKFDEGKVLAVEALLEFRASLGAKLQTLRIVGGSWNYGISIDTAIVWLQSVVENIEVISKDEIGEDLMVVDRPSSEDDDSQSDGSDTDTEDESSSTNYVSDPEGRFETERLFDLDDSDDDDSNFTPH